MNPRPDRIESARQNPFGILMAVFLALALDNGFRLADLWGERGQLDQARLVQAQNFGQLAQGQQARTRLEPLCVDLLQIAATNVAAKRIVQEFNIQNGPALSAPLLAATNRPLPGPSNPPPAASNPPPAASNLPPAK